MNPMVFRNRPLPQIDLSVKVGISTEVLFGMEEDQRNFSLDLVSEFG